MLDFAIFWQGCHPSGPPIAHILRWAAQEHWVRFHSLPLSKRYAETTRERGIVLERANALASRILGAGSECWLVQAIPKFSDTENDHDDNSSITQPGLSFAFEHCSLEDECIYEIYSKPVTWSPGAFDALIAQKTDDLLAVPTMWVSKTTGVAFAPYDGGSDLFLASARDVAELKREFSSWLSDHPRGL